MHGSGLDRPESLESSLALCGTKLLAKPSQTHHLLKPQPRRLRSTTVCLKSNKTKCFFRFPFESPRMINDRQFHGWSFNFRKY